MENDTELISSIIFATTQINRHVTLLVLLFGNVGNLLNIWVFNERSLNDNPCSTYLWWSSISSVTLLWSGMVTRALQGYNINWPNENPIFCKTHFFTTTVCYVMAIWALVGASIDRYLRSSVSVRYRQLSSVQTARRLLIITFTVSVLIYLETLYCFEVNVPDVPVTCYPQSLACRLYNDWMVILFNNIIPSSFMAFFGSLTIRNVRTRVIRPIKNPVITINTINKHLHSRKKDRSLSRMLLIQVLVLLLLNLPVAIQRLYSSLTANFFKTPLRIATENLVYSIIVLLSFLAYSISFYLYTLTGSIFRTALKHSFRRLLRRIRLWR